MSEEREQERTHSPELARIRELLDDVNELVREMAGDIDEPPRVRYLSEFGVSDDEAHELIHKMREQAQALMHTVPLSVGDIDVEVVLTAVDLRGEVVKRDVLVRAQAARLGSVRRASVESS